MTRNLAASVHARLQNHARVTKALDFLGRLENSLDNLENVFREVFVVEVEPEGIDQETAAKVLCWRWKRGRYGLDRAHSCH